METDKKQKNGTYKTLPLLRLDREAEGWKLNELIWYSLKIREFSHRRSCGHKKVHRVIHLHRVTSRKIESRLTDRGLVDHISPRSAPVPPKNLFIARKAKRGVAWFHRIAYTEVNLPAKGSGLTIEDCVVHGEIRRWLYNPPKQSAGILSDKYLGNILRLNRETVAKRVQNLIDKRLVKIERVKGLGYRVELLEWTPEHFQIKPKKMIAKEPQQNAMKATAIPTLTPASCSPLKIRMARTASGAVVPMV